ncbi:ATP-dependent Clp protease ATP-binding subunit [bacterium]|jgi:ATP-dependent Clp protease ATP-binding subunit ClpC|nr:ATP-dependent Clp protease ATP-binding subunit [bacterium]MBT7037504.1 ATP-dependent Clp protease ATP-binding subunit [bacterium]MBT7432187.1 ATP-dependent Clp protease ATP-binding subunit [bacterium]MBT7992278.1 ATP-dependent Clp protease ATP-binding subunit [bacterium]
MRKRFTKNAQLAIATLKTLSGSKKLSSIDAKSFIQVLLKQKGSFGKTILETTLTKNILTQLKESKDKKLSKDNNAITAQDIINRATKSAFITKSTFIGTEHLANEILEIPGISENITPRKIKVSSKMKKDKNSFSESENALSGNPSQNDFLGELNSIIESFFHPNNPQTRKGQQGNQSFYTDLTSKSQEDYFLIGREYELERISHILGRKMKNNPVLIGDPGVGKTAIVEGLAKKIQKGTTDYHLCNKKILSLDLGLLVAGTTFRGEFEARLKDIITQVKKDPNIILFIDEIHNLVGAGNATGGMDAANLLKPILSRGEIQLIGATTIDEYRKYIEKDAALERRLQPILVKEPTVKETKEILTGIKESYEKFHNVSISADANMAAATLAKRYITDRNLPDSAIDLIDETAARLRSETSDNSIYRKIKKVEEKLERIKSEKELLVIGDRYEDAIRMRAEENKVSNILKKLQKELKEQEKKKRITLTAIEVKNTLAKISGIPKEILSHDNNAITMKVKSSLRNDLMGHSNVKKHISNTILRQVSGISNPNRPLGSFLFVGPSGVGKTHCAKVLATAISPMKNKDALIQINMSEFMEKHTVSRLLGAPAGYVGYEEGGEFSDKVRRNPYSVILFDEIEKADPSVLNVLLQILEEGEVSDAKGRRINFRNTIVVLTSNIGLGELNKISELGFNKKNAPKKSAYKEITDSIVEEIQEILSPELVNRLDHVLPFNTLSKKNIEEITKKELGQLQARLAERLITLTFDQSLITLLAKKSSDPELGARQIRKHIQEHLEPVIARKIVTRKNINEISISTKDGKIIASLISKKALK